MARAKSIYQCASCGAQSPRPDGRCLRCGEWGTLDERMQPKVALRIGIDTQHRPLPLYEIETSGEAEVRVQTGMSELDRVLGGGLVAGSVILIGGDPGVGKSTLLLMALDQFAKKGLPVLYASGEESARQIALRAKRLGVSARDLQVLPETDFDHIATAIESLRPVVTVVDSVQTVHLPDMGGVPGSVAQIREVAHRSMLLAKQKSTAVFIVGHVTKTGDIAGPKVLEHLVDTVLYFEGDGRSSLRVLRSVKNRFGATGEVGVFDMVDHGLVEVPDASARLLEERSADSPGTSVISSIEGSRPLLAEIQALVGRAGAHIPARTCVGVDRSRVLMLAAILEKSGCHVHDRDIFVNAAGGIRVFEPAADLAIVAAIASSLTDAPIRKDTMVFGELGLVGEVRSVSQPVARLKEAARHGFRRAVVPTAATKESVPGLELIGVQSVSEALKAIF